MNTSHLLIIVALAIMAGCSSTPMSFEEAISRPSAVRGTVKGSVEDELKVRVGFQYAYVAYNYDFKGQLPSDPGTLDHAYHDALAIPLIAYDFYLGNSIDGAMSIVTWFDAGFNDQAHYRYHYVDSNSRIALPNTHYYRFEHGHGPATPEDVHQAWDAAYDLFTKLFPAKDCVVYNWKPSVGYRHTVMKDEPGVLKQILYSCPHPLVEGEIIKVNVSAWGNPASDLKTMAWVEQQCWIPRDNENYVDIRDCGEKQADRQWPLLPHDPVATWIQLFTTPTEADPGTMVSVVRFDQQTFSMANPGVSDSYAAFLRALPSK